MKNFILQLFKGLNNKQFAVLLIGISISFILLSIDKLSILENIDFNKIPVAEIFALILLILAMSIFMYSYLQGNTKRTIKNIKNDNIAEIVDRVDYMLHIKTIEDQKNLKKFEKLFESLDKKSTVKYTIENKGEIFDELKNSIRQNISKDFFEELNLKISKEILMDKREQLKEIDYSTSSVKSRLKYEIERLDRKSNINLIVGSAMTLSALLGLGYIVFEKQINLQQTADILIHYIPRISFIIFIEVFAFFFLKLYKLNLNDIKYYQNELTNIDLKNTSLLSSLNFGTSEDISGVIKEFSKTERNFIIGKGQSTIELEKYKYEQNSTDKYLKLLKNIIKTK